MTRSASPPFPPAKLSASAIAASSEGATIAVPSPPTREARATTEKSFFFAMPDFATAFSAAPSPAMSQRSTTARKAEAPRARPEGDFRANGNSIGVERPPGGEPVGHGAACAREVLRLRAVGDGDQPALGFERVGAQHRDAGEEAEAIEEVAVEIAVERHLVVDQGQRSGLVEHGVEALAPRLGASTSPIATESSA